MTFLLFLFSKYFFSKSIRIFIVHGSMYNTPWYIKIIHLPNFQMHCAVSQKLPRSTHFVVNHSLNYIHGYVIVYIRNFKKTHSSSQCSKTPAVLWKVSFLWRNLKFLCVWNSLIRIHWYLPLASRHFWSHNFLCYFTMNLNFLSVAKCKIKENLNSFKNFCNNFFIYLHSKVCGYKQIYMVHINGR